MAGLFPGPLPAAAAAAAGPVPGAPAAGPVPAAGAGPGAPGAPGTPHYVSPQDFFACDAIHDSLITGSQCKLGNLQAIIDRIGSGCNFLTSDGANNLLTRRFPGQVPSAIFPNSFFANNKIVSENLMVQYLFNYRKNTLKQLLYRPGPTGPLGTNQTTGPAAFILHRINFCIFDIPPPAVLFNPAAAGNNRHIGSDDARMIFLKNDRTHGQEDIHVWNTMFSLVPLDVNGLRHVYLVSDSASHFIGYMSESPNVPQNLRVHCMFSSSTFADPASLITSDSTNIIKEMESNRLNVAKTGPLKFTHTYRGPINVGRCNKISMLDATIDHIPLAGNDINETISYHNNPQGIYPIQQAPQLSYNYQNARQDTSVTNIKGLMNAGNPRDRLLIAQSKRLGDHNQIGFIKYLCEGNNCNNLRDNTYIDTRGSTPAQQQQYMMEANANLVCRNDNTFFVTQDYPAFCWAVYNRINCILIALADGVNKFQGFLVLYWY
jgi:hypothetical protein